MWNSDVRDLSPAISSSELRELRSKILTTNVSAMKV